MHKKPNTGRRLRLERLELRALLAQLQVGPGATYSTIQSALENARPNDEILVARAVYSEAIDLARMGQAVGGARGNISIAGREPGVILSAPTGPAIQFAGTATNRFPGNITIQQLTVESAQPAPNQIGNGVRLLGVTGNVSILDSVFRSLGDESVLVDDVIGKVTILGTDFESTGDAVTDRTIVLSRIEGMAIVSENTFNNVLGTAIDIQVPAGNSLFGIIDENAVLGDGNALSTTQTAISAQVSGTADLSFVTNQISDLGAVGIKVDVRENGELQARIHRNTLVTLNSESAIRIDVRGQSESAIGLLGNVVDLTTGDGLSIHTHDSARLDVQIQENVLFVIGNDVGDNAISLTNSCNASGSLHASLSSNSITDVTGDGVILHLTSGGDMHVALFDNVLTQANANGGTAAIVASTASGSTGTLTTQFRQNRILDIPKAGYSLEKRGTPAIQLGGTASNATAEITSTNDGGAVLVVGQVNIVDSANLPSPPASIGNYVWLDNDGNGIQDGTETGARFVELRITGTDEDARPIDRRTLSDANGEYFFSALIPGEYTLTVNLPRATALVTKLQGDDRQFDSNFDQTTRQFAVQLTTDDLSIDAGLWSTYTNPRNPLDVNDDTFISPIDALLIINDLNTGQSRALVLPPPPQGTPPFIDTSADNFIAPIDVLLVINAINASSQAEGELGEGELAEEEMMADFARFAQIWYAEMEAQISEKVARRLQLL